MAAVAVVAAAAPKEKSKKLKIKPAVPTAKDLAVYGGSRQAGKLLPMAETESDMESEFDDFTEDESTDEVSTDNMALLLECCQLDVDLNYDTRSARE